MLTEHFIQSGTEMAVMKAEWPLLWNAVIDT